MLSLAGTVLAEEEPVSSGLVEQDAFIVGGEPKELVVDEARRCLYVSDFGSASVAVVDLGRGLVVRRMPVPAGPAGLALAPDQGALYVACYLGGCVVSIDLESGHTQSVSGPLAHPWDVAFVQGPLGQPLVAVSENEGDRVTFLAADNLSHVATVVTDHYPYYLATCTTAPWEGPNPSGSSRPCPGDSWQRTLYVACLGVNVGGRLEAIDLDRLAVCWRADTDKGAFGVAVLPPSSQTSGRVLVSSLTAGSLTVFDFAGKRQGRVVLGGEPRGLSPWGEAQVAVTLRDRDQVIGVDVERGEVIAEVAVGKEPVAVAGLASGGLDLDQNPLVVANRGDGTISVVGGGPGMPEFQDVGLEHRFARPIRVLNLRGVLGGYQEDGLALFKPEDPLTRAQAAKVLVSSLGLQTVEVEPAVVSYINVCEEQGEFPFDFVQEASRLGIVRGLDTWPPSFSPYQPVTRLQLVRMAARAAAAQGSALPAAAPPAPFVDIVSTDPDADLVAWAYAAGIVAGVPGEDGWLRLMPYTSVSRGQAAKIVFGLLAALHRR